MGSGAREMSAMVEQIVDSGVAGQKALGAAGRSESLHLPLPPTNRHMRALRAIVAALALDVPRREAEIAEGGAIGAQPVGDDYG